MHFPAHPIIFDSRRRAHFSSSAVLTCPLPEAKVRKEWLSDQFMYPNLPILLFCIFIILLLPNCNSISPAQDISPTSIFFCATPQFPRLSDVKGIYTLSDLAWDFHVSLVSMMHNRKKSSVLTAMFSNNVPRSFLALPVSGERNSQR